MVDPVVAKKEMGKDPVPKKKVSVRLRPEKETEEPVVLDKKIEGDYKMLWSDKELDEGGKKYGGAVQGTKYASYGKKLTPLTPEEQKEETKKLGKIPEGKIGSYVQDEIGYKGEVESGGALQTINALSKVADEKQVTSPADVKALFEGPYRKEALRKAGLNENQFNILTKEGSEEGKKNLYYSILQQVNAKRKNLPSAKQVKSSFVVDETEEVKAPEKKEVILENPPDKAFKLVKDAKGNVRKVKK